MGFIVLVSLLLCMLEILHNRKIKINNATNDIFVHKSFACLSDDFCRRDFQKGITQSKLGTILSLSILPDKLLTKICCTNLLLERLLLDKWRRVGKVFQ